MFVCIKRIVKNRRTRKRRLENSGKKEKIHTCISKETIQDHLKLFLSSQTPRK